MTDMSTVIETPSGFIHGMETTTQAEMIYLGTITFYWNAAKKLKVTNSRNSFFTFK